MNILLIESLTFGLNYLVKSAEEMRVKLYLITQDKNRYFYELSQIQSEYLVVHEIDTFNVSLIVEYAKKYEIQNVINLTDTWCHISQEVKKQLGLPISNDQAILVTRNKDQLRKKLIENKLTSGVYMTINLQDISMIKKIQYPVIIKDIQGTGSKNVWFANDEKDLDCLIQSFKKSKNLPHSLLIETYFKGTLYSAETITYQGQTKLLAISNRILSNIPHFMEYGGALPMLLNTQLEGVEKWVKTILKTLSYQEGFAHTEFVVTDSGYEVIEVNPRLGGGQIGHSLCTAFETNIYSAFLEIALGKSPTLMNQNLQQKNSNRKNTYLSSSNWYLKKNRYFTY